jgi:hypothetical protein
MAMNKRGIGVVGVIVVLVLIVAAYFILIRPVATGTLQVKITDAAENITALTRLQEMKHLEKRLTILLQLAGLLSFKDQKPLI